MTTRFTRSGLAAMVAAAALAISGCGGGSDAPAPTNPPPTNNPPPVVTPPPVAVPTGTSPIVLTASTPAETFRELALKVNVGRVTIDSPPVVHFSVTDQDGNAVIGFGQKSATTTVVGHAYANLGFSLAKLVPASNGSPAKWVNYIVTTVPTASAAAAPTRPTTDNTGTLVDHNNGTYTYTFYRDVTKVKDEVAAMTVAAPRNKADLGDLTYEPNLVHRLSIQVSGNAPGTGTNTPNGVQVTPGVPLKNPLNVIYDFVPATGQAVASSGREVAANAACNDCHTKLGGLPGSTTERPGALGAQFHGGARNDVRYCVVCHTEQRKYDRTEAAITKNETTLAFTTGTNVVDGRAIGNLPNYIHKIHGGAVLAKSNYNYAGVAMDKLHYSQDVKNCTKCHDGSASSPIKTAQGDNWKTVPSRLACGSCHDGIDFATGKGVTMADALKGSKATAGFAHPAMAQADDSKCALCHTPATIDVVHLPVTPPDTTSGLYVEGGSFNSNAAWLAASSGRLPEGAVKVSYDIKSVSRNSAGRPVMVFRLLQNGVAVPFNNPATKTEIWDGFMGAPSVYFVFSVPQDGRTVGPDDFNASANSYLRSLWNGTATGAAAGTLTGPDADGYYTATLTGVTIPTTARMLTGGIGYSYNIKNSLPLTQTNLAGFPVANSTVPVGAANTQLTAGMPNKVGGLVVVAPNVQKVATGYTGRRAIVDDARCNACHQELGLFTESSFHGGQRNDGSTCAWCHTPNRASGNTYLAPGWSIDSGVFIHAIHGAAKRSTPFTYYKGIFTDIGYPGVLQECEACHLPGTYDFRTSASANADRLYRTAVSGTVNADLPLTPSYVTPGDYGAGFSFSAANGTTTQAAGTTRVHSPITAACSSCHDTSRAVQHMQAMGGSFYAPRSTALGIAEQCVLCHGAGKVADVKQVHSR